MSQRNVDSRSARNSRPSVLRLRFCQRFLAEDLQEIVRQPGPFEAIHMGPPRLQIKRKKKLKIHSLRGVYHSGLCTPCHNNIIKYIVRCELLSKDLNQSCHGGSKKKKKKGFCSKPPFLCYTIRTLESPRMDRPSHPDRLCRSHIPTATE